jgi:Zn-dependent protease with chaperone function
VQATYTGHGSASFFLWLLTESFAVRALVGSLAAAGVAALLYPLVHTSRARRVVVLAPVVTAITVAAASSSEAYLPQLWVTAAVDGGGRVLEVFGELQVVTPGFDLLLLAWSLVAGALLLRRGLGLLAARRLVGRADVAPASHPAVVIAASLAKTMGLRRLRVGLLPGCPGGALTTGTRWPVVLIDPDLIQRLDNHELEGLVAHELAHVARRDPSLGVLVGVVADLVFFLPAVRLAQQWLHREQEESADELARRHTQRPGALASSILKVWDSRATSRARPQGACAAAPLRLVTANGPKLPLGGMPGTAWPAAAVTARVLRLVHPVPSVSDVRRRGELAVAILLCAMGTVLALAVPSWVSTTLDATALSFAYVPPPAVPVESPAFATFRALTPALTLPMRLEEVDREALRQAGPVREASPASACPCEEAPEELSIRPEGSRSPHGPMAWRDVAPRAGSADAVRPLWALHNAGPDVGFFLVGRE